jgi:hypothetical protein
VGSRAAFLLAGRKRLRRYRDLRGKLELMATAPVEQLKMLVVRNLYLYLYICLEVEIYICISQILNEYWVSVECIILHVKIILK